MAFKPTLEKNRVRILTIRYNQLQFMIAHNLELQFLSSQRVLRSLLTKINGCGIVLQLLRIFGGSSSGGSSRVFGFAKKLNQAFCYLLEKLYIGCAIKRNRRQLVSSHEFKEDPGSAIGHRVSGGGEF